MYVLKMHASVKVLRVYKMFPEIVAADGTIVNPEEPVVSVMTNKSNLRRPHVTWSSLLDFYEGKRRAWRITDTDGDTIVIGRNDHGEFYANCGTSKGESKDGILLTNDVEAQLRSLLNLMAGSWK